MSHKTLIVANKNNILVRWDIEITFHVSSWSISVIFECLFKGHEFNYHFFFWFKSKNYD